jgi:hypothetical protein
LLHSFELLMIFWQSYALRLAYSIVLLIRWTSFCLFEQTLPGEETSK